MSYIKSIITLLIIAAIAIVTFQNISVFQIMLVFKFFNMKSVKIPIYYFFIIFFIIIFLIILFYKIKCKILIEKKNKKIDKLEKEINNLRNLEISESKNE